MSGREQRRVLLFCLVCLIVAACLLLVVEPAPGRPPVPGPVFQAVRAEWKSTAQRVKAFDVASCETGGTYSTAAANGQHLGIFQMGLHERRRCGHGWTAWAQARAARCWFDLTGQDWSPWSCA